MKKFGPQHGSYSNDFMYARGGIPQASSLMAQSVSQYRKEILAGEVSQGLFKDGSGPAFNEDGLTRNSNMSMYSPLKKSASFLGSNFGGGGGADSLKQMPEIYSPLWLTSNLNIPRDRATINAWCRAFFALNPFVNNAIKLHSTYPISKLNIKCADKKIEQFFNDMIEEIDLMNICVQIAQEIWLLGEAFVDANYDPNKGKWDRIQLQNPDFMIVQPNLLGNDPLIMIRPDERLKTLVKSNRASDIEQRKQMPQSLIDSVKKGENILVDNFRMTHLANKISPYELRGTGLPVCIFKQLALFDKLRESKFAQSENMVNPMTLVKIGSEGNDGLHPSHADLESWRAQFESAASDKNWTLFTHPGVTVERVGYGQGIYDISGDITQLVKEIYVGLEVPAVLMDGGADTSYANGGVAMDILRQRYMQFRTMLSTFLKRKIFAPISQAQEFWENKNGKKQLIIPEIDWNHMALFDTTDYINTLVTITQPDNEGNPSNRASLHALHKSMGLEYEDEQRKLKKEAIQNEILKKEKEALAQLSLNELRSLDEDEDIPEPIAPKEEKEEKVPGEMSQEDLGGLPGLGGPGAGPEAAQPK